MAAEHGQQGKILRGQGIDPGRCSLRMFGAAFAPGQTENRRDRQLQFSSLSLLTQDQHLLRGEALVRQQEGVRVAAFQSEVENPQFTPAQLRQFVNGFGRQAVG